MRRTRLATALAVTAAAVAAAVIPAAAGASVQVGSSGWQWGNPLPQGNTLRSMSFAGNDGYAAGARQGDGVARAGTLRWSASRHHWRSVAG